MNKDFINLNGENISDEHLCCIIRSRVIHPGVESKRAWLCERLKEGHVFRKLNEKATVFIEYAPLETAWTPIVGENYLYIYCLWVSGKYKGHGYGKSLMNYCIEDAKLKGKSGVCMLGSVKQKAWLSDQSFAKEYGFDVVDTTNNGYQLLALSFDGTKPKFTDKAKKESIENKNLTIFYDMQCPYISQNIEKLEQYCKENDIPISLNKIETLEQAKNLPCVFNNMAIFYKGIFKTVNLIDENYLKRIMKK
jgi:GNAT superfamily N-acetyltransferase